MIVEPNAGDRVEDNLNPVGRAYYGFSTLLCTPASLSQEVGLALGAQAGEARIRDVVAAGGFTPLPARGRDAVQPRVRGAAVSDYDRPRGRAATPGRPARAARRDGLRRARRRAGLLGVLRRRRAGDPAAAAVVDRALAACGRRRSRTSRATSASSTFDARGNGLLGPARPTPRAYADREFVADALAVLDAAGVERGVARRALARRR